MERYHYTAVHSWCMRDPAPQDSDLVVHEWEILLSGGSFSCRLAHTIISYAVARTTVQYACTNNSSILVVLCYDENEMGGECSVYGGEERRIGFF